MKAPLYAALLLVTLTFAATSHAGPSSTVGGLGQPPTVNGHHVDVDPSMGMTLLADASTPVVKPTSADDAVKLIPDAVKDLQTGGPGTLLGIGLAVLVVTYFFRAYALERLGLSPAALPWVAIALGVLAEVGYALATGKPWVPALLAGLLAGLSAPGVHEALGQHVVPSPG